MQKSKVTGLIVVLIVLFAIAGWTLWRLWSTPIAEQSDDTTSEQTSQDATNTDTVTDTSGDTETVPPENAVRDNRVVWNNGYAPVILTINVGDTVTFFNGGSNNMWPASNVHPTHGEYPVKSDSDCLGSSFDACGPIAPGSGFEFTFTQAGTFDYHDHLNPSKGGRIIVK